MSNLITFLRPDVCPKCKRQAIELYDYYGNSIGYRNIIDKWMYGYHENITHRYSIYNMKCKTCGQQYNIIWRDGIPLPEFVSGRGVHKEFISFYVNEVN